METTTTSSIVAAPDEHVLLTGPIKGEVTLADGTVVDVTQPEIALPAEQALEVAHLIGLRHQAEQTHPDHTAAVPFVYDAAEEFVDYEPHPDNATVVAGTTEA